MHDAFRGHGEAGAIGFVDGSAELLDVGGGGGEFAPGFGIGVLLQQGCAEEGAGFHERPAGDGLHDAQFQRATGGGFGFGEAGAVELGGGELCEGVGKGEDGFLLRHADGVALQLGFRERGLAGLAACIILACGGEGGALALGFGLGERGLLRGGVRSLALFLGGGAELFGFRARGGDLFRGGLALFAGNGAGVGGFLCGGLGTLRCLLRGCVGAMTGVLFLHEKDAHRSRCDGKDDGGEPREGVLTLGGDGRELAGGHGHEGHACGLILRNGEVRLRDALEFGIRNGRGRERRRGCG